MEALPLPGARSERLHVVTVGPESDGLGDDRATADSLVAGAQSGDAIAMNDLLDLLAPFVSRICGPIALFDGADATQEALIVIFRSIRQLREPAALFGWARAIAVREAIRVAQRSSRVVPTPLAELPSPGDPELEIDLLDTLERLSPEHRAVLVLRHIEGLDEHEMSAILKAPEGTVRSRMFRARRAFKKEWCR